MASNGKSRSFLLVLLIAAGVMLSQMVGLPPARAALPSGFEKTSPANGATGQPLSVTLAWQESTGAVFYEYCYDSVNNTTCEGTWTSTNTSTSAVIDPLSANTTYYWHVRAWNGEGSTYSNGGDLAWWSFTTAAPVLPGSFAKTSPENGATGQPLSVTLAWGTSSNATYYSYCYDTTNDSNCGATWSHTTSTSAVIGPLSANTTYYWHVRAVNDGGETYSNDSQYAFWQFTTAAGIPGSFNKLSPTNYATGQPLSVNLAWGTSANATSYQYCYDTTNDGLCSGWATTYSTSRVIGPLSANTTYYWHVRAVNTAGTTYSDVNANAFWRFTTGSTALVTVRFRSVGPKDGWVLESSETSGAGGTTNVAATTCRVGDDASDRQFRSILDFRTGRLPDNAVITRAVLKIKPASLAGPTLFITHGNLIVDIRTGGFSGTLRLQTTDFQAPATRAAVATFRTTPVNGKHASVLPAVGRAGVNLQGHTQFRLRFSLDDNDNARADYLDFFCGNSALVGNRPVLIITYYVP